VTPIPPKPYASAGRPGYARSTMLMRAVSALGDDVEIAPKKGYLS
jgi:hypothetical protein